MGLAAFCAYLREAFDPLQGAAGGTASVVPYVLNPIAWEAGSTGRFLVAVTGFAMTGFFVSEINQRRRRLAEHLEEREKEIRLRLEAEHQLQTLADTSPLGILTLNGEGKVLLANDSARQLLGFAPGQQLRGESVEPYLPILGRMLHSHTANMRTNVECKGQRRNGDVFLANVWLSTYSSSRGSGLAAVIWDASENLRDREGAGLDSMMATSRVLIGAFSHEIRNLASAAATAYTALETGTGEERNGQFRALGALIQALEKVSSSGLRAAAGRERTTADLGTVLDEARIVIEPGLREAGIEAEWQIPTTLPLVQGDHHSLLQVFVNLARNSVQAMERSERRQLAISAAVESDLVVVRVRDTGAGVAHPEELFRPFHWATAAVAGNGGGIPERAQPNSPHSYGLGLYISRAILRSHGGGLRYEPQPVGSCFAVELWPVENEDEDR
jgi:PAS domain S-box-containing protein